MLWLLGLASSVSHGGSRSLDFLCFVCSGDKIFLGCVSSGPYPYSGKSERLDFCNFVCYHSPAWYWIVRGGAHQVTFGKYILQIRFTICLAKFSRQPDCVINLFQSSVKKDGIFQSVIFFCKIDISPCANSDRMEDNWQNDVSFSRGGGNQDFWFSAVLFPSELLAIATGPPKWRASPSHLGTQRMFKYSCPI